METLKHKQILARSFWTIPKMNCRGRVDRRVLSEGDKPFSWDPELHLLLLRTRSALMIRLDQVLSVSERMLGVSLGENPQLPEQNPIFSLQHCHGVFLHR